MFTECAYLHTSKQTFIWNKLSLIEQRQGFPIENGPNSNQTPSNTPLFLPWAGWGMLCILWNPRLSHKFWGVSPEIHLSHWQSFTAFNRAYLTGKAFNSPRSIGTERRITFVHHFAPEQTPTRLVRMTRIRIKEHGKNSSEHDTLGHDSTNEQMAMGQKENAWGPQVLIDFSFYQWFFRYPFDQHPNES